MTETAAVTMHVKIYAPFRTYFDDTANSISARNRTGDFDILPHHKNFITLLIPGNIVVRVEGKPDFILPITKAFMHVKADQAIIFLDV
jgi:F0F1-type ATP synthase epsilon subunit